MARKKSKWQDDWQDGNGSIIARGTTVCSTNGCSTTALYSMSIGNSFKNMCSCCHLKLHEPFVAKHA